VAITRRELVARSGFALGAAALAGYGLDDESEATAGSLADWAGVRSQFALRRDLHDLSAFVLATHPRSVRTAIERHRKALDASPVEYLHANQGRLEARVRAAAGAYLKGAPGEIALTDSTTMGLGLLYGGLRLADGDEILTTTHDFFATHDALRLRAQRTGARVRRVSLYRQLERVTVDELVDSLARGLTPRTRVVAVTWVHSSTGLKLPIRPLADALAGRALLCVDGVHALGVEDVDVRRLGAAFLVAGCHKWLHGPRGTGLVWGRAEAWVEAVGTIPSFDDPAAFAAWFAGRSEPLPSSARSATPGGFHSFEHRWALAEAFAFHRAIGKARVAARVHALARRLKDGLAGLPRVTLRTPRSAELSAGIVCFEVAGVPAREAVRRLRQRRVLATDTPYAAEYVRFGAGLYSSDADVDAALAAVRSLSYRT
jgi:selenocysteine lyase/cysteine desulfurase